MNDCRRSALLIAAAALLSVSFSVSADSISSLPPAAGASYSAKVDGVDFAVTWVSTTNTTMGGKPVLNVTGHIGEGLAGRFINCNIVEPKVGSFPLGGSQSPHNTCSYTSDVTNVFSGSFSLKTGSIEITELDAAGKTVSGTFSASGQNMAKDKTVSVTEGHFAKLPLDQSSRLK